VIDVRSIVQVGTGSPVPTLGRRRLAEGPGDEDDDVTPIGDPPDDDGGDDWDDEDDEEEDDDEDPLQAVAIILYCGAASPRTKHRGTMASD
jgi:hypothetical protein